MTKPIRSAALRDHIRQLHKDFENTIVRCIANCPDDNYSTIAEQFGLTPGRIAQIAVKHEVRRRRGPKVVTNG